MRCIERLLAAGICALLVLGSAGTAYASESYEGALSEAIQTESINEDTISVQAGEEEGWVTVTEDENERIITMTDYVTGDTNYIKYDKNANTVYSSLTGETTDLAKEQEYQPIEESPSTRSVTSYETKYISYAQIKKIVGNVATAIAVIGALLYFVPNAQSIGGAASAVGTIVEKLSAGIPASSKHGIKLKIKVTKYYRGTTSNRHVYKTIRSIVGGSIY